jgi:hypothetical protein
VVFDDAGGSAMPGPIENRFIDRSQRFDLHLALRFFPNAGMVNGHCANVSESGMMAIFEKPVDLWLKGDLSIVVDGRFVSIKAMVARVKGREAGMAFLIESEEQKSAVQLLVSYAKAQHQPAILMGSI